MINKLKNKYLRLNNYKKEFNEDNEQEKYEFEGYLAKYDNQDRHGDVIVKGAFKDSINTKKTYTLRYNHITEDYFSADTEKALDNIIGTFDAEDREDGVYVYGKIFPEYKKVYELLKSGALSEMSIGFMVEDADHIEKIKNAGYKFIKAVIREGSIVDVPANPKAVITAVKNWENQNNAIIEPEEEEIKEKSPQISKEELQNERKELIKNIDKMLRK